MAGSQGRDTASPRESLQKVVKRPRQSGAPAKDLHRIPQDHLKDFIELSRQDIQRMLRDLDKGLSETGTKVELFLRYRESLDLEKREERHRTEAEAAQAKAEQTMMKDLERKANLAKGLDGMKHLFGGDDDNDDDGDAPASS